MPDMNNSLILMCGAPACGKSTFSKDLATKTGAIRLSSDELRGIIGSSESDQTVTDKVFRCMQATSKHLLAQGHSVIIDATNASVKGRKIFLEHAKELGVRTVAYVFQVSLQVLKERNAQRERKVPEDVINRYHGTILFPLVGEVDEVIFVK